MAEPAPSSDSRQAGRVPLSPRRRRRRAPRVPRRHRAGLDGAGRAADPRPGEGRLAAGARRAGTCTRRWIACCSTPSRWPSACAPTPASARIPVSVALHRGAPGGAGVHRPRAGLRAADRRGRNHRTGRAPSGRQQVRRLIVANRTLENAQELADRFGGYAIPLADLPQHLAEADIVISATASRAAGA